MDQIETLSGRNSPAYLDLSNVENLDLSNVGNLIELDFLMKPDYFPVLRSLHLIKINIVTIPESITKFTRLETLEIKCCKYIREIPRLPRSIRGVYIVNSHSLHAESSNRLFSQFGEFCYLKYEISQPRRNPFAIEEGDYELILPGSEIPKWFNHQSIGNSISFCVGRYFPKFVCCIVFEPNELRWGLTLGVTLKFNGIRLLAHISSSGIQNRWFRDMTSNHVWFFKVNAYPEFQYLFDQNRVEVEFTCRSSPIYLNEGVVFHILRCGIHAECICPRAQDLSTDTLPPTSIPAFPICSISNTVCLVDPPLEGSDDGCDFDFDSPLEGSHDDDDGCELNLSLCTSPPQVTVPDDASHISLPSSMDLPNNITHKFELRLGLPGLEIGSTVSQGFHLGSSSMAHNFVSDDDDSDNNDSDFGDADSDDDDSGDDDSDDDDSDFNPSKKMRKS